MRVCVRVVKEELPQPFHILQIVEARKRQVPTIAESTSCGRGSAGGFLNVVIARCMVPTDTQRGGDVFDRCTSLVHGDSLVWIEHDLFPTELNTRLVRDPSRDPLPNHFPFKLPKRSKQVEK